ncbi:MAG: hypothetical protein AB7Q81_10520 [Gammaproteobacteria bacterium]
MPATRPPMSLVALLTLATALTACNASWAHGDGGHPASSATADAQATVTLPAASAPTLAATLVSDANGRLVARLMTTRFQFAADKTGQAHQAGEGHAHLVIDGTKAATVTTPEYALPTLTAGTHQLAIGLMSNDHRAYAVAGRPIAARFALRVSGEAGGTRQDFDIAIAGDKATPSTIRVTEGDTVSLHVAADAPAELHLHGYDIEAGVAPGDPVTLQFTADIGGRFPLERHVDDGGGHGHGALLYLEVYPD